MKKGPILRALLIALIVSCGVSADIAGDFRRLNDLAAEVLRVPVRDREAGWNLDEAISRRFPKGTKYADIVSELRSIHAQHPDSSEIDLSTSDHTVCLTLFVRFSGEGRKGREDLDIYIEFSDARIVSTGRIRSSWGE
jgi:hypothetical protein